MELVLQMKKHQEKAVLHCYGKLIRGLEAENFKVELDRLFSLSERVLIDFNYVRTIDGHVMGILAAAAGHARREGKSLELCRVPHHIVRLLRLTRLDLLFEIHPTGANLEDRCPRLKLPSPLRANLGFA